MKKIVVIFVMSLLCLSFVRIVTRSAEISFEKKQNDFGVIQQFDKVSCRFSFKNTGDSPLVLSDVKTSCGCTTSSWTKKPVPPGQKGSVKVEYNASSRGAFRKTIAVYSNASNDPHVLLIIKGNVVGEKTDR